MSEHSYHKLYDRLVDEVKTLYYANQVRIHKGLWALIISTVLFLTIMFITNGSKVIFLLMWIATMFAVAAYLIAVEYLNFELKRKVEEITRREQDFGEETADIVVRQRRQRIGFLQSPADDRLDLLHFFCKAFFVHASRSFLLNKSVGDVVIASYSFCVA